MSVEQRKRRPYGHPKPVALKKFMPGFFDGIAAKLMDATHILGGGPG